jgi:hypothetical protein
VVGVALEFAWSNWDRVAVMEYPVVYLFRVGLSKSRHRKQSRTIPVGTISNNRRWLAVAASILVAAGGIVAIANLDSDDPGRIGPATHPTSTDTDTTAATTPSTTSPSSEPAVARAPASSTPTTTTVPTTTTTAPAATSNPEDRLASWPAAPVGPFPANDIPRLLPTVSITPAGTPVRAQVDGGSASLGTFTQVFANAERDILLTLQTHPNGIDLTPTEMRLPVTIDGWDDAFGTIRALRLVASDPSGYVRLSGTGIDQDEAVAIIATMQRRPDDIPGWDLAPQFEDLAEINGA